MGDSIDINRVVKLIAKLSFAIRSEQKEFSRKKECARALLELKYETTRGRYDLWHSVPKIASVIKELLGEYSVKRDYSSITELASRITNTKKEISTSQLKILKLLTNYSENIPNIIDHRMKHFDDSEYLRNIKIRDSIFCVKNIETIIGRDKYVIYLHYLIQMFDTQKGKDALSIILGELMEDNSQDVRYNVEKIRVLLDIPYVKSGDRDYSSTINQLYKKSEQSYELNTKTSQTISNLRVWLTYDLLPLLKEHENTLKKQAEITSKLLHTWKNDYSERAINDAIIDLSKHIEKEQELFAQIREETGYFIRSNQSLKDVINFMKQASGQLMTHHKALFDTAIISYGILPLLSAFYSADEFEECFNLTEHFLMPQSKVKKIITSISIRGIAGIF